jgi:hypothetical protein
VKLLEGLVELVDLRRIEVELVERERDLLLREKSGFLPLADQRLGAVLLQRH